MCLLLWIPAHAQQPTAPKKRKRTFKRRSKRKIQRGTGPNVFILSPQQTSKLGKMTAGLNAVLKRKVRKEMREIQAQIEQDKMPIPKGLGAIFVPLIIKRSAAVRAPSYLVYDKYNRLFATAKTGRKAFVPPGIYTVKVGRRLTDLLPTYRIRVYKDKLTVLRPRWAALVVRVVDTRLVQFRGRYDIIHLKSRLNVGTGLGADDNIGEKVQAWLLPPGVYMLVRTGDSYLARTNFLTVRITQGQVTFFRLVADRNTGEFLGGGIVLNNKYVKRGNGWNFSLQLNGSFIWNQQANVPAANNGHTFSLTSFLFGRLTYNTKSHFFLTTLNAELGFTSTGLNLRKGSDLLSLQSIYIYRILSLFGPYVRAGFETSIFPRSFYFNEDNADLDYPVSLYDCVLDGNGARQCSFTRSIVGQGADPLELGSFFDPFLLKQGIGISLQTPRTPWFDLRLLFGIGFRQESARNVNQIEVSTERCLDASKVNPNDPLDLSGCSTPSERVTDRSNIIRFRKPSSHREGLELALVATGFVSRFFTFTTEFDALGQFQSFFDFDIDWRTSLILRLSHYASIIYRLRIRRDPAILATNELDKWYIDQSVVLTFSLLY